MGARGKAGGPVVEVAEAGFVLEIHVEGVSCAGVITTRNIQTCDSQIPIAARFPLLSSMITIFEELGAESGCFKSAVGVAV